MQNIENVKFLAWPNVRNQVVVQKNFFKERFSKNNWCCLYTQIWKWCKRIRRSYMSMLGSILLLVIKKILYCKLLSFAVTVDVTDILQTSKQNFLFRAKNMSNLVDKYLSNDKKISMLFAILILMSVLFLLRYYGSCYRLQHVEKQRTKHRKDVSKKIEHAEKSKKETCWKSKERRKMTEVEKKEKGPKLHAAAW